MDSVTEAGGVVTGVTIVNTNGEIIYTPTSDFNGETIISYTVSDGSLSDTGLITVSVTAVNDAPTIGGTIPRDITVTEDLIGDIDLSDTLTVTLDADTGIFTATGTSEVTVGGSGTSELSLTGNASDINSYLDTVSNVQYTGASDLSGDDAASFTITVSDGILSSTSTVNLDITAVNDAPVALDDQTETTNEDIALTLTPSTSDADGDTLTITVDSVTEAGGVVTGVTTVNSNGEIVYTPTSNFNGETIISYTASDGALSDTGLITVSVTAVNDAGPIAADDQTETTNEDTVLTVSSNCNRY